MMTIYVCDDCDKEFDVPSTIKVEIMQFTNNPYQTSPKYEYADEDCCPYCKSTSFREWDESDWEQEKKERY